VHKSKNVFENFKFLVQNNHSDLFFLYKNSKFLKSRIVFT